jgi:type II secretory pathway pseudopilin PulG
MVVLAIIGILASLLLPAIQSAREAARRAECSSHIRQIGLALHTYHQAYGSFAPGFISQVTGVWSGLGNDGIPESGPGWSMFAMILPFVEQQNLHNQIDFNRAIGDVTNRNARSMKVPAYRCPSDDWRTPVEVWPISLGLNDLAPNSYVCSLGGGNPANAPQYTAMYEEQQFNGMFHRNDPIRISDVLDGTSNTFGVGERSSMFSPNGWAGVVPGSRTVFSPWMAGRRKQVVGATSRPAITTTTVHVRTGGPSARTGSPGGFWSPHIGGCYFVMMDGSTQFLSVDIDLDVFRSMAARNDGQPITAIE